MAKNDKEQRAALYGLARNWAREWTRTGGAVERAYGLGDVIEEAAWAEVLALIDRIADERVVEFAKGALLAADGIAEDGVAWDAQAVVNHIRNTVAQIALLEKESGE